MLRTYGAADVSTAAAWACNRSRSLGLLSTITSRIGRSGPRRADSAASAADSSGGTGSRQQHEGVGRLSLSDDGCLGERLPERFGSPQTRSGRGETARDVEEPSTPAGIPGSETDLDAGHPDVGLEAREPARFERPPSELSRRSPLAQCTRLVVLAFRSQLRADSQGRSGGRRAVPGCRRARPPRAAWPARRSAHQCRSRRSAVASAWRRWPSSRIR